MSEGRRHFLAHYEGIESGEECQRWLPVLSAMVDGEASPEQVLELRPHLRNCPGCRATLRALQDSSTPLAALLPVPLAVGDAGFGDQLTQLATRLYESVASGLHERAVNSFTKAQAVVEASAAGKVAAVAASAAAVAGGGYVSVERMAEDRAPDAVAAVRAKFTPAAIEPAASLTTAAPAKPLSRPATARPLKPATSAIRGEFAAQRTWGEPNIAPEFRSSSAPRKRTAYVARSSTSSKPPTSTPPARPAPEFSSRWRRPRVRPMTLASTAPRGRRCRF